MVCNTTTYYIRTKLLLEGVGKSIVPKCTKLLLVRHVMYVVQEGQRAGFPPRTVGKSIVV